MEIRYTNIELDKNIFEKNEIIGLYDREAQFIKKFKKMRFINIKVSWYFALQKILNKSLLNSMLESMEITKDIYGKFLYSLSSSELIKVLAIKACLNRSRVILLPYIDNYLTSRDLSIVIKSIRKNLNNLNKVVIFYSLSIDNIIQNCTKYIIYEKDSIIYTGRSIDSMPIKSQIMEFVDKANKKGANILYYKDSNDLLKAIYRSVKK